MKTDKVVFCPRTQKEYDCLMQELEKAGCKWASGRKATELDVFGAHTAGTYIFVSDKEITYGNHETYWKVYKNYEFIEVSDIMPKGTTKKIKTDKVIYHTRTEEEYNWLMQQLEKDDCCWCNGKSAKSGKFYYRYLSDTYIWVEDKTITYGDYCYYKNSPQYRDHEFIEVSDIMPSCKDTKGKPKLSLVPPQILFDIAEVREYGSKKYPSGGKDNWKNVDINDYKDALLRHTLKYLQDPKGKDSESEIEHYKHVACNMAFICEMEAKYE